MSGENLTELPKSGFVDLGLRNFQILRASRGIRSFCALKRSSSILRWVDNGLSGQPCLHGLTAASIKRRSEKIHPSPRDG